MPRSPVSILLVLCTLASACEASPTPRELGPVVIRHTPPPAVRGGGLLLFPDASVLVSDADRDRLLIFDLRALRTVREIDLDAGAEPGRAALSSDGRVHVVLHGAGAVLTFDLRSPDVRIARRVCPMPAGVACVSNRTVRGARSRRANA